MTARWPRLLKLKSAAEYCDMTTAAFEKEVLSGRLPNGRVIGGREHWDKVALDRAIDALMGIGEMPDYRKALRDRRDAA